MILDCRMRCGASLPTSLCTYFVSNGDIITDKTLNDMYQVVYDLQKQGVLIHTIYISMSD